MSSLFETLVPDQKKKIKDANLVMQITLEIIIS